MATCGRYPGLVHEDENPHDDQAVRVDVNGQTVAYLTRASARIYRRWLAGQGARWPYRDPLGRHRRRLGPRSQGPCPLRGYWFTKPTRHRLGSA